jgi:deoxyribose-phosphate aldolase
MELCNGAKLKVTLKTGELETVFKIRKASEIAIKAGADFLKTSTGKIKPTATPEAFLIMLDTIKEYYEKTGNKIGVTAAGGITEPEDAIIYFQLVKHVLGDEWLNKKLFRIGASRLANKLVEEIKR